MNARTLLITGLALFAMFFGAGNLIFAVMIGIEAGTSVAPAMIGFILTGVILPVLGTIAAATAPEGVEQIANRMGHAPGVIFTIIIFLSTGVAYAIPRVASVSYEMVIAPAFDGGWLAQACFLAVFFLATYLLAINPRGLLDRIGGWLTPVLLACLLILIAAAIITLPLDQGPGAGDYASEPLAAGLIKGYFTMDAIASLVFGIVIIASLRRHGLAGRKLFTGTALAGIIAGIALTAIYLGLAAIGARLGSSGMTNGAEALAHASDLIFGRAGQLIFGSIVLLACLTTAVGLTGASTQYFRTLIPSVGRVKMMAGHVIIAFLLANLGLDAILDVVAPINQLIYPVTICLILTSLLGIAMPGRLWWTYRLTAWTAACLGLLEALRSTEHPAFDGLGHGLDVLPLGAVHLPWVAPALIAFAIGLTLDLRRTEEKAAPKQAVSEPVS